MSTVRHLWNTNRWLTFVGAASALSLAGIAVGLSVDPRSITGLPAWIKPAKFAVSISLYCLTLVWLLSFVRGHRRVVSLVAGATAIGLAVELVIIVAQVVRGTTSHYNVATPLDSIMWNVMSVMILVVWVAGLVAAVVLLRQRIEDSAFAWSLRLGLLIALVGMLLGLFMTLQRSPDQIERMRAGQPALAQGAHAVTVNDGGAGLPLLGWSTEGGDLRIGHFIGIHSLQAVPLVWLLVSRRRFGLGAAHQTLLVITASVLYLGVALLTTWQALRGQSIVAPDGLTVSVLATLLALAGLATLAVVAHARRSAAHVPGRTVAA
jgi:hypothetical protein